MRPDKPVLRPSASQNASASQKASASRPLRDERAFSLLEAIVTLLVMVQVAGAIMILFNQTNKLSRAQNDVALMQQQQRVAQHEIATFARMAGAGGMSQSVPRNIAAGGMSYGLIDPGGNQNRGALPRGLGVGVISSVANGIDIDDAANGGRVLPGTDILTLRGQINEPTYYVGITPFEDGDADGTYLLTITNLTPGGVEQNLEILRETLTDALAGGNAYPEAFIVRDTTNPAAYAVLELNANQTVVGNTGDATLTLGLRLAGATYDEAYGALTLGTALLLGSGGDTVPIGGGPTVQLPANVGSVGILEEYRYYIRQEYEIQGDATTRLTPILARARMYPGTNTLHRDGAIDIADNIIDLQVALGIDRLLDAVGPDGVTPITNGLILDNGDGNDEVLYNNASDDDELGSLGTSVWAADTARLAFVRFSTVAQSDRIDLDFEIPDLAPLEDHTYVGDPMLEFQTRKRVLTTIIDFRNL